MIGLGVIAYIDGSFTLGHGGISVSMREPPLGAGTSGGEISTLRYQIRGICASASAEANDRRSASCDPPGRMLADIGHSMRLNEHTLTTGRQPDGGTAATATLHPPYQAVSGSKSWLFRKSALTETQAFAQFGCIAAQLLGC